MSISYNFKNESAIRALLNKYHDLIQDQAALISRQDAIIGSLSAVMGDIQRYSYSKMQVARLANKIDYLEDELKEVQDV